MEELNSWYLISMVLLFMFIGIVLLIFVASAMKLPKEHTFGAVSPDEGQNQEASNS